MSNKTAFCLWAMVGAIFIGKGLHALLTPEFYSDNSRSTRLSMVVSIVFGTWFLIVARNYFKSKTI